MFKRKKKSPSAKDINALTKKSDSANLSSQSYSSLPKSMYSGNEKASLFQSQPTRSTSALGPKTLNLSNSQSSQEISGNSPLDLPMETLQSISAAYNLGRGYTSDTGNSLTNTPHSKSHNRSPFQSPVHSAYSANSSNSKAATRHRSLEKGEFSGLFSGDSTLERQFERLQMMMPSERLPSEHGEINSSSTLPVSRGERRNASMNYSRDRSQEREQYPHMGARSLERDHYFHVGNRSISDRQDFASQLQQTQEQFRNLSRDSLILELQSQITDLNKDCAKLQTELDSTKDKLSSTMNSIKTFWSPELKKERSLRKEESAKYSLLNEQYKATQAEVKKQASNLRDLDTQLRLRQNSLNSISTEEHENLKRGLTDQTKEVKILRKTVDEMEIRLETQKQTLGARDESIKKLLEMLHSKGLAIDKIEESQKELEKNRIQSAADTKKILKLQKEVDESEKEINKLKESNSKLSDECEHARVQLKQQPASTHTLQAIMEAKDSRISALEKELQNLEDKLHRFGEDGAQEKDGSLKEHVSSREKALKSEIESLKNELTTRDIDVAGQKMKVDTLTNQQTEHKHYINVLKDQIKSKEEQSSMFQADIDDLRERLKEKDSVIGKKATQCQGLTVEKRKLELECAELKDNLEIKERKITLLQRKVENLEELLQEKEEQLLQAKTSSTTASQSSDSAISSMEESITDKERQIERLKEQRDLMELEHQQECEQLTTTNQHLKTQLDTIQLELSDKQTELCELREEVSELKSSRYKAETRLRQLELSICEKDSEISKANGEVEQLKTSCVHARGDNVTEEQLCQLSRQVEQCQTEMKSAQTEVDRLLEILKECELEKQQKDGCIKEYQDMLKEYKQKFGTLRRQQQSEKKKNANLLEEARRREEDVYSDADQLKGSMKEKEGRIEELEEALRESVKITAEREMLLMEQKMQIDSDQSRIEELQSDQLKAQNVAKEYATKLASYVKQLEDKDNKLKKMNSERHKHLEEVFEMKQEALQAAICEKDANIALLEMTSTKKQRNVEEIEKLSKEKEKMNQQLKELAQNRTRYLQEREKTRSLKKTKTKTSHQKSEETSHEDPATQTEQKTNDET